MAQDDVSPDEGDDPVFRLDYWKVAGALCRAFVDDRDDELFWKVVAELSRVYPFDWRNVMTDSWPLVGNDEMGAPHELHDQRRGQ